MRRMEASGDGARGIELGTIPRLESEAEGSGRIEIVGRKRRIDAAAQKYTHRSVRERVRGHDLAQQLIERRQRVGCGPLDHGARRAPIAVDFDASVVPGE